MGTHGLGMASRGQKRRGELLSSGVPDDAGGWEEDTGCNYCSQGDNTCPGIATGSHTLAHMLGNSRQLSLHGSDTEK